MPNLNDIINEEKEGFSRETIETISYDKPQRNFGGFLRTPSLDKSIQEYLNHPFNKNHDEDLAQGLRGVEAFLGATNLAIIDLAHLFKYMLKKMPKLPKKEEVKNES